jgi:regulator of ribonuclease activity A
MATPCACLPRYSVILAGYTRLKDPCRPWKVYEDNSLVRSALEEDGQGRVLVVDGAGSLRCALVGDNLAALGARNKWAGIVVFGCIRDSIPISEIKIGVKASRQILVRA